MARAQSPAVSRAACGAAVRGGDRRERLHADRWMPALSHPPCHQTTQAVPDRWTLDDARCWRPPRTGRRPRRRR